MSHDAATYAKKINTAIKGLGTNEKALNEVFSQLSKDQLIDVAREYHALFGASLAADIKGDTSGHYQELLVGLASSVPQAQVNFLRKATKGAGTTEKYIIDVLAPSSNAETLALYQHDPTVIATLINDIGKDDFSNVVKILLKAKRSEDTHVNEDDAAQIAETLYKAGEGKWGTDEDTFTVALTRFSVPFLKVVDKHYTAKHKHSLEKAIKGETSGDYERILVALTKTKHEYFADRFFNATEGLGTDEEFVSYAFSVLSKDDLAKVSAIFHERHPKTTLAKQILGDVSGDYADLIKLLLA